MTDEVNNSQVQDQKGSDKELNFRALESKYERALAEERGRRLQAEQERQEIERLAQEALTKREQDEDDDSDSEPYVSNKKLEKKLEKLTQNNQKQTHNDIEKERQNAWLEQNPDFYQVLEHAEKLPSVSTELAKIILKMPDTFERQKLVYANVKALGLNKPQEKPPSIQEKVDSNRRSPYYQPTGIAAAP